MIEIFHISDLHFGQCKNQTDKSRKILKKIENKFKITSSPNKYLLVTGDITEHGLESQYKIALEELIQFKDKVFIVPGNHDYGFKGFIYYKCIAECFDKELASSLGIKHQFITKMPYQRPLSDAEGNKVLLIGLNSCLMTEILLDIAQGEIGEEQLNELIKVLDDEANKNIPRIVYLHHIPHKPAKEFWMHLNDWKKLMKVVKNKVNVLAFGHEGSMEKPMNKALATKIKVARKMGVKSGKDEGVEHILDANDSVKALACYHISIEGSEVLASVEKLS